MPPRGLPNTQNSFGLQQQQQHLLQSNDYENASHKISSSQSSQYHAHPIPAQHPSASARSFQPVAPSSQIPDMQHPSKQHYENIADSNISNSDASVWLHSGQQPVTDEELNALLASKPWNADFQGNSDDLFENMLSSSMSAAPWPPASTIGSLSNSDVPWTGHNLPAQSIHNAMPFDMTYSTPALHSDVSLSPSSYTNSPFYNTSPESNFKGTSLERYIQPSSVSTQSQSMQYSMTTPHTYTSTLLDNDPSSSPEDAFLLTSQLQQHQYTSATFDASPISMQGNTMQQSIKQSKRPTQRRNATSSMSLNSSLRNSNANISNINVQLTNRPRSGTYAPSSIYSAEMRPRLSNSSSAGTMDKIQESSAVTFSSGITNSLSAELAGLGLDVSNFPHSAPVENRSIGMQRRDSSSSSSTAHARREQAESSFLSQATSSLDSSGLDDSLLSVRSNIQNDSRWVHGKDTPPSSPAPSLGSRTRLSILSDQRMSRLSTSSPYSRPDELGMIQSRYQGLSPDWSSTWSRVSMVPSDSASSRSSTGVPSEISPMMDSQRHRSITSPANRTLQDRKIKRHSRGFSSVTSLESMGALMKRSNESLQSDIGPSRSSRIPMERTDSRRMKRMSASFVSEQEARRLHQEKQSQYDQVSDALDTLRRFLRQREDGELSSRPTSYVLEQRGALPLGEQVSTMLAESSNARLSHSSNRQRTLRHPPTGPLPPRGSIFTSPDISSALQEGSRVEAERIAALEDLAKRVRQMKDENQQMLDDL